MNDRYRKRRGFTNDPFISTIQWRCAPVVFPVLPSYPMTWPFLTLSPTATGRFGCRWAYQVRRLLEWAMTTIHAGSLPSAQFQPM